MFKIPNHTRSLEVLSFADEAVAITQKKLPPLKEGELLIHAFAAPINPLDILKIEGLIPELHPPFTLGSECSGIVIDAKGHGLESMIGKKVSAFSPYGCMSDHVIVNAVDVIVQSDDVDMEQAACGFVNPITALGLVDIAEDHGAKALISTAANSSVGKNILQICQKKGLEVIGVVRGEKNVNQMKNLGCTHVLDLGSEEFEPNLRRTAKELKALVALDCYSGAASGILLNSLPKFGLLVNYGSLKARYMEGIEAAELRFGHKMIKGFAFFQWLHEQHEIDRKKVQSFVAENFGTIFKTQIAARVNLEHFKEGLNLYRKSMSAGKVIVHLSQFLRQYVFL